MNVNSTFKKLLDHTSYGTPQEEGTTLPTPLEYAVDRLTRHDPQANVDQIILQAVERAGTEAINAKNQERKNELRAVRILKSTDRLERVMSDVYEVLLKLKSSQVHTAAEAKVANDTLKAASKELASAGYILRNAFDIRPARSCSAATRRPPRIRGRHG